MADHCPFKSGNPCADPACIKGCKYVREETEGPLADKPEVQLAALWHERKERAENLGLKLDDARVAHDNATLALNATAKELSKCVTDAVQQRLFHVKDNQFVLVRKGYKDNALIERIVGER